jgi:hypothetical protein
MGLLDETNLHRDNPPHKHAKWITLTQFAHVNQVNLKTFAKRPQSDWFPTSTLGPNNRIFMSTFRTKLTVKADKLLGTGEIFFLACCPCSLLTHVTVSCSMPLINGIKHRLSRYNNSTDLPFLLNSPQDSPRYSTWKSNFL